MWHEKSHGSVGEMGERFSYSSAVCRTVMSHTDQKDAKYYPPHRNKGHALEQCVMFRRMFHENHLF